MLRCEGLKGNEKEENLDGLNSSYPSLTPLNRVGVIALRSRDFCEEIPHSCVLARECPLFLNKVIWYCQLS